MMETESFARKLFTSILNADCSKGNLLGISIEPETSIKKTRWLAGNVSTFNFREDIFMKNS